MRHCNHVNTQMDPGKVYLPEMIEDADGTALGNNWTDHKFSSNAICPNYWAPLRLTWSKW